MLKTPEMAAYEPRPIRLMTMQKNTEIQTAYKGVPVLELIFVQIEEPGMRRSRENANTVRPSAC
jgi:hypothetical protein